MKPDWLRAIAAALCALSVALGAYASHAASGRARQVLGLAAAFAFAHALALITLGPRTSTLAGVSKLFFLAGIVLFSGSLAAAGFFAITTVAAPLGGSLLILGWLLAAADYWRNP